MVYRLRALGLAAGFASVASVLRLHDEALVWWLMIATHTFVWPHVAWFVARRSADPREAEFRNLMIDSTLGGVWIAVMQFNLLPSVLVATMLSMDKISAGGLALLARASLLLLAACAVASAALGFPVDVATISLSIVLACLPLLVVYPMAISYVTYDLAARIARKNRQLDRLGRTDALTGLANRRQGFALAAAELARYRRTGRPAVLVVLDIDRFKDINDRYGHPAGDEGLCAIAQILRVSCRAVDVVARYGGDEFLLVFPDLELRGAEAVAKRIRHRLETHTFETAPDMRCTVSIGAAEVNVDTPDVETWIQRADAALYRAKASGRDRFIGTLVERA